MTETLHPSLRHRSLRCEPMKPAPPVMSMFTKSLLVFWPPRVFAGISFAEDRDTTSPNCPEEFPVDNVRQQRPVPGSPSLSAVPGSQRGAPTHPQRQWDRDERECR